MGFYPMFIFPRKLYVSIKWPWFLASSRWIFVCPGKNLSALTSQTDGEPSDSGGQRQCPYLNSLDQLSYDSDNVFYLPPKGCSIHFTGLKTA